MQGQAAHRLARGPQRAHGNADLLRQSFVRGIDRIEGDHLIDRIDDGLVTRQHGGVAAIVERAGALSTVDAAGHRVDCERLLLPFGSGAEVEQMVGSMPLISLKGNFERGTVLDKYRTTSRIELAGRIPAGIRKPEVSTPGLVIEIEKVGSPDAARYQHSAFF